MTLSNIEAVRLKSSDKSIITRETGLGDGHSKYFKLAHAPILLSPIIEVRADGVIVSNYTVDTANGVVTFTTAPLVNVELEFMYYWSIYSDAEIQYFIDEADSNTTIAAAKVLLAIAADASKVAQRQSMAGGGGLGAVTIDTSVTARELRNTAKAMIEMEAEIGQVLPVESLTEPLWTEMNVSRAWDQRIIRDN